MDADHHHDEDEDEDEAGDEDGFDEMEVTFEPRPEALAEHGITPEAFEKALLDALEAHEALVTGEDVADEAIPSLESLQLEIDGRTFKVTELADIEIDGDLE